MALILFAETEGELAPHDALALDISAHGLRIQAGAPLTPGQVVEVFPVEGNEPFRARVVWVGKPASEVESQAGLEFLDPFDVST
jgi:hypothetical protein